MTKSNYVTNYIKRSRCCTNEELHDGLLTYMTNLQPTSIRDLIKNASTSFVQSIFVITKDYIKQTSPRVHKRYGIEIPSDLIPLYIEKVCDGIESCILVDMYIRQNRNRDNILFHNKLRAYMSKLDGSKLKEFIENASQDCIDALCITDNNSKEKSKLENERFKFIRSRQYYKTYTYETSFQRPKTKYFECQEDSHITNHKLVAVTETLWEIERYGVYIPTGYMPLYIRRWFDRMKKSKDIENYFNRNRNTGTIQFQTALQNLMVHLEDEEIKTLIETTTNDFLHKLFVTTEHDIKLESKKMYRRYGIVIPEQ